MTCGREKPLRRQVFYQIKIWPSNFKLLPRKDIEKSGSEPAGIGHMGRKEFIAAEIWKGLLQNEIEGGLFSPPINTVRFSAFFFFFFNN